jgi:hypothetical protein
MLRSSHLNEIVFLPDSFLILNSAKFIAKSSEYDLKYGAGKFVLSAFNTHDNLMKTIIIITTIMSLKLIRIYSLCFSIKGKPVSGKLGGDM